ncbi:MAG: hypothetical protein JRG89_06140 [Deltaproteobacteria bacterium]|nr:hypothetical protein [Deltaproteobacteria bacterium]
MRIALIVATALVLLAAGYWVYWEKVKNPRVVRELIEHPDGEQAARVMLLTLPSGRRIPVNYYREDDVVYAGADGTWWKELVGEGFPVTVLARAVLDDPAYTERAFEKLRPNAIEGFGTLVEVKLEAPGREAPNP